MIEKTLQWWFETPGPLAFDQAIQQLSPLQVDWWRSDSDYRADFMAGAVAKNAQVRLTRYGVRVFEVTLTVEAETADALSEDILAARRVVLERILPLLNAREIRERQRDNNEDRLTGWPNNKG